MKTPLHLLGDYVRQLMLLVPLSAVRLLFVGLLVLLLIWVLRLPREMTTPPSSSASWDSNLKLGASIALGLQILIYCFY